MYLYLLQCCQYMTKLDSPSNLKLILSKLPYKLLEWWRAIAGEIQENIQWRARFEKIVEFIEKHAQIFLDSVFGSIQGLTIKITNTAEQKSI